MLADFEKDELSWLDRRHSNERHDAATVNYVWRISLRVALHEERLLRCPASKSSVPPQQSQESTYVAPDRFPQRLVVGLEYDPLRVQCNRLFHLVEKPANVDITPFARGISQGSSPPNQNALFLEETNHVHAVAVEQPLLIRSHPVCDIQRAADYLVGGGFVYTARGVAPGIDAR